MERSALKTASFSNFCFGWGRFTAYGFFGVEKNEK